MLTPANVYRLTDCYVSAFDTAETDIEKAVAEGKAVLRPISAVLHASHPVCTVYGLDPGCKNHGVSYPTHMVIVGVRHPITGEHDYVYRQVPSVYNVYGDTTKYSEETEPLYCRLDHSGDGRVTVEWTRRVSSYNTRNA